MIDEIEKLVEMANIAKSTLPEYEIRGVYRLEEVTPAGRKCHYEENVFGSYPSSNIFGGVLLACPRGDRTNGKAIIEVSTRDNKIFMRDDSASSSHALRLQRAYLDKGYKFEFVL